MTINPHYLLGEYKIYKRLIDSNEYDDQLNFILWSVEKFLNDYFGIYLLKSDYITEKFSVTNGNVYLPSYNVSLISAKLNDEDYDLNDLYLVGHILKSKSNGLIDGIDNFELTYTIGFDLDKIPFAIKQGMFIIVDKIFENIEYNANLASSITDPVGGREVFNKNIPKEAFLLLSPYSVINI